MFVGQRKDPFVVNLGETFDLVNIKYPATELNPLAEFATTDSLADANVTSLILEVPIACLTEGKGTDHRRLDDRQRARRRALSRNARARASTRRRRTATASQVSRLGMPLVNEVVIGLKDKNKFNASEPKDDGQFADYVTNPTLPTLLEVLFGGAGVKAPTNFPRTDLVAAFLTGIDGVNKPANVDAVRDAAAQHGDRADAGRRAEPARRARRRQRRLSERPPAGRRRRRHRAARRDGRAVHAEPRRLQAGGCAGRRAALHRRRLHQPRRSSPTSSRTCAHR